MGFYYISVFSIIPLAIAYGLVWLVYRGIRRVVRGWRHQRAILVASAAVLVVLPVAEELWIAFNFGQACKDAGTVIYKTVKADGFYDDTHGWRADKLRASPYSFVEGRDQKTYWRHERDGNEIRSFRIAAPTARYHYAQTSSHERISHKVVKHEDLVRDTTTQEVVARDLEYGRHAPWFFVGLDRPLKLCPPPGSHLPSQKGALLYRFVIEP